MVHPAWQRRRAACKSRDPRDDLNPSSGLLRSTAGGAFAAFFAGGFVNCLEPCPRGFLTKDLLSLCLKWGLAGRSVRRAAIGGVRSELSRFIAGPAPDGATRV